MERQGDGVHSLWEILNNQILMCALTAWFTAQALKIPTYWLTERKLDWMRFFGSGGMPSSHTAFVVSLTIMVGATMGFDSALFAVTFTLAAIVMYDAAGVRRETGRQAEIINEILRTVFVDGKPISNDKLKELIGHTKVEVGGGFVVGVVVALIYLLFI